MPDRHTYRHTDIGNFFPFYTIGAAAPNKTKKDTHGTCLVVSDLNGENLINRKMRTKMDFVV